MASSMPTRHLWTGDQCPSMPRRALSRPAATWRARRCGLWPAKFPDELKRVAYLEKLVEHLNRGGGLLISYQRKMSDENIVMPARRFAKQAADSMAAALN
jgi:hypothetical protein